MDPLREHVVALLRGGQAYETFEQIVPEFTPEQRGLVPPGAENSAWQILEHMRVCLRDILDFSQNEDYIEPPMEDYWPSSPLPSPEAWDKSVRAYLADIAEMERLVLDESRDLYEPFPWGDGQTLLREALVAADHAAYHLGQLVELKRWLENAGAR